MHRGIVGAPPSGYRQGAPHVIPHVVFRAFVSEFAVLLFTDCAWAGARRWKAATTTIVTATTNAATLTPQQQSLQ